MKRPPIRWQAFLWIVACGVAGYAAGMARSPVEKTANEVRLSASHANRTVPRDLREEVDAFENFENLLSAESRETDIWKVVSRLPKENIPDALRCLREVRASTGNRSPEADRLDEIESALYFHWAEADPQAALADVSAMPDSSKPAANDKRTRLLESVLAAWMLTDPNAAYRAVKDHEDFSYTGRDMLVRTWTKENVFENLKLFPDKHRDLLGWYCVETADDETRRNAMLAALREQPKLKDRDWAYSLLFRSWGYKNFDDAMAEAGRVQIPWLQRQLLHDNLSMNSRPALQWAASHGVPPGGALWEEGYTNWLGFDPPAARQWFAEQAPAWEANGHTAAAAGFLAVELDAAANIHNNEGRNTVGERLNDLFIRWSDKDPKAAGKWLATAPSSARKLLERKGTGNDD